MSIVDTNLVHYYCSTSTFLSLISRKEIWLTALRESNDALEGKWALKRFASLRPGRDDEYFNKARHILASAVDSGQYALGMCFSEHRDLLSQWRGYADDGQGFSVGFSKDGLKMLSQEYTKENRRLDFSSIKYWEQLPREFLVEFKSYCDKQSYSSDGAIVSIALDNLALQDWIWRLSEIKNPAFREEAEHRLFAIVSDKGFPGARFRNVKGNISPYIVISIESMAAKLIKSVSIGPKNNTSEEVVKAFLKMNGLGEIYDVVRSRASYR